MWVRPMTPSAHVRPGRVKREPALLAPDPQITHERLPARASHFGPWMCWAGKSRGRDGSLGRP
jgi:hypothetical protein